MTFAILRLFPLIHPTEAPRDRGNETPFHRGRFLRSPTSDLSIAPPGVVFVLENERPVVLRINAYSNKRSFF